MIHKLAILSGLIISAFCAIHPGLYPQIPQYPHPDNVNYDFSYEVNNPPTGDIKRQQESRRGDTVIGQYSLLQPDGIRRTVDYKADDLGGFRATVNNDGAPINNNKQRNDDNDRQRDNINEEPNRKPSLEKDENPEQAAPTWPNREVSNETPSSVAISRTSLFQIIRENRNKPASKSWA